MPSWWSWFRQSDCRDFDSTQVCSTVSVNCSWGVHYSQIPALSYSVSIILLSRHQQRAQPHADVLQGSHPPLPWLLKVPSNQGRWADHRMACWNYCSREQPIHPYKFAAFASRPSQRSLRQDPIIQIVCYRYYSREPSSLPPSAATTPTLVRARPTLIFTSTPVSEKIY